MKVKCTWLAVQALLVAILACNLPRSLTPVPSLNPPGTLTAPALFLLRSTFTPTIPQPLAATGTPSPTPTQTLIAPLSRPADPSNLRAA